jgi:hypothetical protein
MSRSFRQTREGLEMRERFADRQGARREREREFQALGYEPAEAEALAAMGMHRRHGRTGAQAWR